MKTKLLSLAFKHIAVLCALLAIPFTAHGQNLYVSVNGPFVNGAGSIAEYTPAGMQTTFASGLDAPRGMDFDCSGNFLVATTRTTPSFIDHGRVLNFPPAGHATVVGVSRSPFLFEPAKIFCHAAENFPKE